MDNTPDAAFHDIGKLIDWDAVGLRGEAPNGKPESDPHEFQKCIDKTWNSPDWGIDPSAAPWQTILTWQQNWQDRYPKSMHRWHRSAADWLIAGYARGDQAKKFKGNPRWGRYCLWTGIESTSPRITSQDDLRRLIGFLNSSPTWPKTLDQYASWLEKRAEESRPGLNVTTLLAHTTTVGKLCRVLERAQWGNFNLAENPKPKNVNLYAGWPSLIVSHLRLSFRQRTFRARDLGVFAHFERAFTEVVERYPDNVLSRFAFECVCAFESEKRYRDLCEALDERGFDIEERTATKTLAEYLTSAPIDHTGTTQAGMMVVLQSPWKRAYPRELPERIDLPICEGCQMARATKHWPKDHLAAMPGWGRGTSAALMAKPWREIVDTDLDASDRNKLASWLEEWGEEDLCDHCFSIRRETQPVSLLKEWSGDVVYLRLHLDLDRLNAALRWLHSKYLRSLHPDLDSQALEGLFVSFPMIVDFVRDFDRFLAEVQQTLTGQFGARLAELDSSLCCVSLNSRSEAIAALRFVEERFQAAFPQLLTLPDAVQNPVGIALSVSNKKYPFFDHWRFLEKPAPDVSIQIVGVGRSVFRLADLSAILAAVMQPKRTQLYRLAEAANVSRALGEVMLREKNARGTLMLGGLSALVPGRLDFDSALTIANLYGREE